MYTVTIKYTAPSEESAAQLKSTIAPQFVLGQSYVDESTFRKDIPDSAYPANMFDRGNFVMAESLDEYFSKMVSYPSAVLALRSAVLAGAQGYAFDVEDYKDKMYYEELGRKLADDGFTITVEKTSSNIVSGSGSGATVTIGD